MNGYFQIINENDKTYLKLYPATDNGKKIELADIIEYFELIGLKDYDLIDVNKNLENLSEEKQIKIKHKAGYPINEFMAVKLSDDKMTAFVKFYPPSNDGKKIDIDEMKSDLSIAKVSYGLNYDILEEHLNNPVFCTDIVIAKGKDVVQGKDAYVEYMFNADRKAKPRRKEDGSVDFHQLDNINHICKGDLLAVLHPAYFGENGRNVLDEVIKPASVSQKFLKYGKKIDISEDKLQIFSQVDGHVSLHGEQVFVSDVYDVPADVDNSTGDIQYEGNVLVHGSVRTGFKIKASGNVEVLGSVEGAEIVAGGDIILHHGIQGMGKGLVVAKGNIVAKFIESSKVFANGYIEAEAIIQSHVSATEEITINGSKGHVIGGHIRSTKMIKAKNIGSGMGIATIVEVGFDPSIQDDINKKKEFVQEKTEEVKKYSQMVEVLSKKLKNGTITEDQKINYKNHLEKIKTLKLEIAKTQEEYETKVASLLNNDSACVKVERTIHSGVQLIISGEHLNLQRDDNYCKYVKKNGMVVSLPL
ncbi:MAG: DUF342 domain-containing protein [Lachnospiraceae bacterium]|nr:DUF342 domain-containing protein [Lachnospiraceae bacterium]